MCVEIRPLRVHLGVDSEKKVLRHFPKTKILRPKVLSHDLFRFDGEVDSREL